MANFMNQKKINIIEYSNSYGCSIKLDVKSLDELLATFDVADFGNGRLITQIASRPASGAFQINDEQILLQNVDFLSPMVQSPYLFGEIAAANAVKTRRYQIFGFVSS